jgi:carbon-monoxide dehydrogenase large subunit
MADQLGVRPESIRLVYGDTETVVSGGGTHSDRSMRIAGALMVQAAGKLIEQARRDASQLLECTEVSFVDGLFSAANTNRRLSLLDIARELAKPLAAEATFTGRMPAYPTGAAVCELEIDSQTGSVDICRYTSIDDAGQAINPLILHGQMHGGIAQGIGQALLEVVRYAPESGQMLSGSFMDYALPRAYLLPFFEVEEAEDPTPGNPLRVKGGGESGITPAPAAVINAVIDALSPFGIEHLDMPATAARIWAAMRAGRQDHKRAGEEKQ